MDRKLNEFGDNKILFGSRGLRHYQLGIWTFDTYPFKHMSWALNILECLGTRPNVQTGLTRSLL